VLKLKKNYQKELDGTIKEIAAANKRPSLLIHSCCAPCSSYVLEYLSRFFDITIYYYNPNISPESEYLRRLEEQERLIREMNADGTSVHGQSDSVKLIRGSYENSKYREKIAGLENEPEGGLRCEKCFRLRLEEAAKKASELKSVFFTTTLSISPHKNAQLLNEIGEEMGRKYGVRYLLSDFKKKEGYKRSIELSAKYGLYRQDYCGCVYSKAERKM